MSNDLTSRAIKALQRRERTPPASSFREAIVGNREDQELDDSQLAGVAAEAALASRYTQELAEFQRRKDAEAKAAREADDRLLAKIASR